jgi:hypothetical protein
MGGINSQSRTFFFPGKIHAVKGRDQMHDGGLRSLIGYSIYTKWECLVEMMIHLLICADKLTLARMNVALVHFDKNFP